MPILFLVSIDLHFVWYCCVYTNVLMDIKQEDGNNKKDKKKSCVVVWGFSLLQVLGIKRR
jgi:hypothetical protein